MRTREGAIGIDLRSVCFDDQGVRTQRPEPRTVEESLFRECAGGRWLRARRCRHGYGVGLPPAALPAAKPARPEPRTRCLTRHWTRPPLGLGNSVAADQAGSVPGGTSCGAAIRTYDRYVPNKTISVPDDVIPIIESLDVPFSQWVADQLRRHAAKSTMSFADQLLALTQPWLQMIARQIAAAVGERMERSAPW